MATKATETQEHVGRVGQRRQVVIPREMLETLNLREGDFVSIAERDNGLLTQPSQLRALAPEKSFIFSKGMPKVSTTF